MARSTKTNKARQVECCFRHAPAQYAVARGHAVPCARVRSVERQAYRYLAEATHLKRPVEVCEDTVPITLKVPAEQHVCFERMREAAG